MRRLAFLRNRQLLYSPAPATVLLLFERLIKTPICRELLRRLANVLLEGSDDLSQGLYIGDVVLVFHVGKNQTIVIFCQGINPVPGRFTQKHLFRLIDDSLY